MEDEKYYSGYCRCMDCSRTVFAELCNGKLEHADCQYGSCPYQNNCTIADELKKLV